MHCLLNNQQSVLGPLYIANEGLFDNYEYFNNHNVLRLFFERRGVTLRNDAEVGPINSLHSSA